MKKYGVAIPLLAHGFKSAQDILNEHIDVQKKQGSCLFSTDYTFDNFKLKEISRIIFYSNSEDLYFEADVVKTYLDEPEESQILSPKDYAGIKKKTWFLIKDIRTFKFENISNYTRDNGKSVPYQIQNSKRPNKFYFMYDE